MELPDGDCDLLVESMNAMNAESNPEEDERKGPESSIQKARTK